MVHGIYEVLLHTHQTPEQTPSESVFSVFLQCPHNCMFEDSAGHNGPDRTRNTNLSGLTSETMWSQHILIELLTVILLLQTHMHFPSCNLSSFSLRRTNPKDYFIVNNPVPTTSLQGIQRTTDAWSCSSKRILFTTHVPIFFFFCKIVPDLSGLKHKVCKMLYHTVFENKNLIHNFMIVS